MQANGPVWPSKESIGRVDIENRHKSKCKYTLLKQDLGTGTYATVKESIHLSSGYHYATKIIRKNLMAGREQLIQNEIAVLKYIAQFNHKNLLMLNDFYETVDNLYLVTDLCTGGDLFEKITQSGSYYEKDLVHIIKSITSLVAFLHDNHIIHRDLKSENLIFKTRSIKSEILIADFGLAKIHKDPAEKLDLLCGTLSYVAPEVLVQKHSLPASVTEKQQLIYARLKNTGYSFPVDVWSIGVLTYFILCGYMPFDCETDLETRELILTGDYFYEPEEYWCDISGALKDFINKCFELDAQSRFRIADLNEHLFLTAQPDSKVNLLPRVRSNYSLHKLGLSPRQSPINSPRQLSPQQSHTNVQELLKRTTSAASMISMNKLNQQLLSLNQLLRSQQYVPTTRLPKDSLMVESITSTPMRPSNSQLQHSNGLKSYLEESRKVLKLPEAKMNGCLSEDPEVVQMDNFGIKSEYNSYESTPVEEKKFFI